MSEPAGKAAVYTDLWDLPEHITGEILRKARMPELPETTWFELASDWACEVLSSSTAQKDRSLKMPLYAQHGVGHVFG